MAGETHPAQNIDLKEPKPIGVRDVLERLRLEDAEVVDQDLDVGMAADQFLDRLSRPKVPGESNKIAAGLALSSPTAFSTPLRERPVTMTRAPSRARPAAIAAPMPAVLPVTSARLPLSLRSMQTP